MSILDGGLRQLQLLVYEAENDFRLWGQLCSHSGSMAAFWNLSGQKRKLDFKSHGRSGWSLQRTRAQRLKKGYKEVTLDEVRDKWPTFDAVFEEHFTAFVLLESTNL